MASQPSHHPIYYFEEGNVIFLLSKGMVLYKLFKSPLALHSEYFKTLFTLPPADVTEGSIDEHPIVIAGIEVNEFNYVCDYMNGQFDNTQESLTALLNMASFFEMPKARTYAIKTLNTLPTFSAVLQLHLGMRNGLDEWVSRGFREIVLDTPMDSLTGFDIEKIGVLALWAITRTKCALQEHHLLLAYYTPDLVQSSRCYTSKMCKRGWEPAWWSKFAKNILHPDLDSRVSPAEMVDRFEVTPILEVCQSCKVATIQEIRASGSLERDDEIIQEGLALLVQ